MLKNWPRLRKALLTMALLAAVTTTAQAMDVRGRAELPFKNGLFSSGPDAELRQQAIEAAKLSAWNRYTAGFNPARMQHYQAQEQDILSNLDEYIIDVAILDESVNDASQRFSVAVRVSINEAALNARLSTADPSAGYTGADNLFSFVFVAREVASRKAYDARRTEISMQEEALNARQQSAASAGGASLNESSTAMNKTTTGGSTVRKADELSYRLHSGADVDAAMSETLSAYGFDVVGYPDVVAACGGTPPEVIKHEFTDTNEMSVSARKGAIEAARSCDVNYFAVGTLDIGLHDVDPVTGNQRVYVSVRSQVWNISSRLPRRVASVGPIQYAGLGPDPEVAMRNALRLSAEQSAKVIVDQLTAKGVR